MATTPPTTSQRGWRSIRLAQFSLRTLLLAMAIASVGCWIWLQPKRTDESLAGRALKLQRDYLRIAPSPPSSSTTSSGGVFGGSVGGFGGSGGFAPPRREPVPVNVGGWRLSTAGGEDLVIGNFREDQLHGWWETYYPNGRLAVRGRLANGERIGTWKNWSEAGQLRSELNFALSPTRLTPQLILVSADSDTYRPSPNAQQARERLINSQRAAVLEGIARYWHENGQKRSEGQYREGQRTGEWREWDKTGRLIAGGAYVDGKKHGTWQAWDPRTKRLAPVEFWQGRSKVATEEQVKALLSQWRDVTDPAHRRLTVARLSQTGELARLALETVGNAEQDARAATAAISAALRYRSAPAMWHDKLADLAKSQDRHVARTARWALMRWFPDERSQWADDVWVDLQREFLESTVPARKLQEFYHLAPGHRQETFRLLLRRIATDAENWYLARGEYLAVCHTPEEFAALPGDPGGKEAWPDVARWLEIALDDRDVELRQAAVRMLSLFVQHEGTIAPMSLGTDARDARFEIPVRWQPLVNKARSDAHETVSNLAATIDAVAHGY